MKPLKKLLIRMEMKLMKQNELSSYAEGKKQICMENDKIPKKLYEEYGVNCGLRDENGKGVLTGLTRISKIVSFRKNKEGTLQPCDGELWYRGYHIFDLIDSLKGEYGFEKIAYLLLFGNYPDAKEEEAFFQVLSEARELPQNFTRDVLMKAPSKDIMNSMTRSVLTLASYDKRKEFNTLEDNIRQAIQMIAVFPMLAVYGYHAYNHYENNASMYIPRPDPKLSTAENILRMLRPDASYTQLEAKVLDVALILHMEHGGGNNSTFTTRVVTSTGSDTYSAVAAAMSSFNGGANIKVMEMIQDIKDHVPDWEDKEAVENYLAKILDKEAFDHKGLIYGMGHAVYSVSDPREKVLKFYVQKLAKEKGRDKDMALYDAIEEAAPVLIAQKRHIFKGVSPNVDFYSGFVYEMLGIPMELYTPLFAVARIVGWSAHRLEELVGMNKIIRPAYMSVMREREE